MSEPEGKGTATGSAPVTTVVAPLESRPSDLGAMGPREPAPSNASIAPVGLELTGGFQHVDDASETTMNARLPRPRRRVGRMVIGAVAGGCSLILIAALVARASHASGEPGAAATDPAAAPAAAAGQEGSSAATVPGSPPAASPDSPSGAATPPAAGPVTEADSTGTVRLKRPAVAGRVWLDGKKLTTSSALVGCGTHQVRVGARKAHSIDVPCGGAVDVAK